MSPGCQVAVSGAVRTPLRAAVCRSGRGSIADVALLPLRPLQRRPLMTAPTITPPPSATAPDADRGRVRAWLLEDMAGQATRHPGPHAAASPDGRQHPWWKVMCLTGVDYFSTLGYQPGIAAVAAGVLSPIATVVLVLLTLFGALPVYRRGGGGGPPGPGGVAVASQVVVFL